MGKPSPHGDADGLLLTGGQKHDINVAETLTSAIPPGGTVTADKAYDSSDYRLSLLLRDVTPDLSKIEDSQRATTNWLFRF